MLQQKPQLPRELGFLHVKIAADSGRFQSCRRIGSLVEPLFLLPRIGFLVAGPALPLLLPYGILPSTLLFAAGLSLLLLILLRILRSLRIVNHENDPSVALPFAREARYDEARL